jgi:hypothetical protein
MLCIHLLSLEVVSLLLQMEPPIGLTEYLQLSREFGVQLHLGCVD